MQRLKRLVPLAAVLALVAAPAAIAPAFAQGTQQQHMQHMMGATSTTSMLNHAYQEALRAHESVALGMTDMATNHLENVRLTMAMIDPQRLGMSQGMQQQIAAIREMVESVDLPSDRAQAVQDTQQLVSQFVSLYSRAPQAMGGGGGAAQQAAMQPTAFDFTSMATTEVANAQGSAVMRNWTEVERHTQDAITHLDKAIKMGETGARKLDAALVRDLKSIRQDANQLMTHARNKNQQATQTAGKLVGRLGMVSPKIASSLEGQAGGGAGQQQQKRHR